MMKLFCTGLLVWAAVGLGCAATGGNDEPDPGPDANQPADPADTSASPEAPAQPVTPPSAPAETVAPDPAEPVSPSPTGNAISPGVLLPLAGGATIVVQDGKHLITVPTEAPSAGWTVKLRPLAAAGEKPETRGHAWLEFELVGVPPDIDPQPGSGKVKQSATLLTTIPAHTTVIIHGVADGKKVSVVPSLP